MNLKTKLYNHFMRRHRLEQLGAPKVFVDKETAAIEGLKSRIAGCQARYKTDLESIEEIELSAKNKMERWR